MLDMNPLHHCNLFTSLQLINTASVIITISFCTLHCPNILKITDLFIRPVFFLPNRTTKYWTVLLKVDIWHNTYTKRLWSKYTAYRRSIIV